MLTESDIKKIIEKCRKFADSGLDNGVHAVIPPLEIDILQPPCDFLGVQGNPAIFINDQTFKLLGWEHETWVANRTIAFKVSFLEAEAIQIIGATVHETGHAFNISAGIENTEANACIFEIEAMRKLHATGFLRLFGCSSNDLQAFFRSRMVDYHKGIEESSYLKKLVEVLQKEIAPPQENSLLPLRLVTGRHGFFDRHWAKEQELITEKLCPLYRG